MSESLQEKKARLRSLLEKPPAAAAIPKVEPRPRRSDPEPLSFAQEGLWFVSQLEGPNPAYNIPILVRFFGKLDVDALSRALSEIVRRHDALRTRFVERGGVPGQVVSEPVEVRLEPQPVIPEEAEAVYRSEARRPFDILDEHLFRASLFAESGERFALVVTMHHSISDAWSTGVFLRELTALYESCSRGEEPALPAPAVTYTDYAHWEREWLGKGELERQLGYWKDQLKGLPPPLLVPVDRPHSEARSHRGGTVHFSVPQDVLDGLRTLSHEQKGSLFVTLMAALNVLLQRYSSQRDVAIGTGVAKRRRPELEDLLGYFVNILVARTQVAPEQPFTAVMRDTREVFLRALAHQDAPYHRVVEELRPERSQGNASLFQVLFTMQNAPYARRVELPDLTLEVEIPDSGAAKFDLAISIQEEPQGLQGQIEYRADLFDEETVRRLAGHYEMLLRRIVAEPELPVGRYDVLADEERRILLETWSGRDRVGSPGRSVQSVFEERARRNPEAVAVVQRDRSLTYEELNARANQLARHLRRCGVGEDALVGLYLDRSPEMIVALMAVLKAGGAFLPIDTANPRERLRYVLTDGGVKVVLTSAVLSAAVPDGIETVIPVEEALEALSGEPRHDLEGEWNDRDTGLAYVMYTSGSTGEPKGVAVEHRGITRLVCDASWAELNEETVALHYSTVSFDALTLEVFPALLNGGRVVLLDGEAADVEGLAEHVVRYGVNILWLSAGLLTLWVEQHRRRDMRLRYLLVGGDVVPERCVREIYAHDPVVRIVNGYGPTENTVFSTCYPIPRDAGTGRSLPIGKPIKGTSVYVLNESMQLQPVGCVGELYVGGAGLARGYLNRPALTEQRFVRNPFSTGADDRLYKTGDNVRWLPGGDLEFIGRVDNQVKVRGFRIELEEIELQLLQLPEVRAGAVVVREDRPGEKRLAAYAVGPEGRRPDPGRLRDGLASKLPEYMMPSVFVVLDAMPLTPNGKVDRASLPAPDEGDYRRAQYVAPRTELERQLCGIWQDVLGVERVGIADDFFDLGGHSLLATRVASRVRSTLEREMPLRVLFEHPTIEGLCEQLPELSGGLLLPPIEPLADRSSLPLSYAQQRLWFIDRLEGGSTHYNVPEALRVRGELDLEAFAGALRTIVERHESLRTVYREVDGEVRQIPQDTVDFTLAFQDLGSLPEEEREAEVRRLALADAGKPFDLGRDLMLRAEALKLSDGEHAVLLNLHHIAADGWSVGVLMRELQALYEAYRAGEGSPLEPLRVQYADYAHWQRQWLQGQLLEDQLGYWRRQLAGLPALHNLPLDKPRPARQGFDGGHAVQRMGRDLKERMEGFCREAGVTPFMLLEAAFAIFLGRYSQETDIVVGSPIAGRVHRDVEPLIGFFVNTLVLRSDLSGNPRFADLLAAGKQTILDAYVHQHAPFEMLVQELQPERSLSYNPLFQILFVLQSADRGEAELGGAELEWFGGSGGIVKLDLEVNVLESVDGLALNWLYKKELFYDDTIARMASDFGTLLEGLLATPDEKVEWLPLLSDAARRSLLAGGNGRGMPYPRERSVHELFEAQAERSPDAVAVLFEDGRLTYRELNQRANRLARLLTTQGVGTETRVGLCLDRSLEMLAGLLGILKAGGAYVPLDPELPEARLGFMLADSGAEVVLTRRRWSELRCLDGRRTVILDDPAVEAALQGFADGNPPPTDARHLAYVIYTSGSTGQPKGVMVEHGQLVHTLAASLDELGWEAGDRIPCLAPFAFDIFLFELLSPLLAGGRCELVPLSPALDLDRLAARLPEMTRLHAVPALMARIVELAGRDRHAKLRTLFVGGDAVPADLLARMREAFPAAELRVLYGPTEAAIIATSWQIEAGKAPSGSRIGRALPNVQIRVCDPDGNPVPVGVSGEIRIGGSGVARGYLNRPDLTAERFVPDSFESAAGARLYRTGDLARWLADGELEFLGRIDHQVKVRGFRIELGEIESQLLTHPSLREAVAIVREDRPGERRLVAYVVGTPDSGQLRDHLAARLPEYMLPAVFVSLERLPLSPNGKVDRRALPAPEAGDYRRREYVAPRTELERRLCGIWEELLGVEPVGIEDNFFDLGGHSLLATQVVSRVRSALGLELPLRALFEHPTVGALSDRLPELGGGLFLPAIEAVADRGRLPLSYAQQRLWFLDRLEGGSVHYNIPGAVRVRGGLDKEAFARALRTIVARHESLRTVFREADEEVWQVVREDVDLPFRERDLSGLDPEERERAVRRAAAAEAWKPFDLRQDLMLRAELLTLSDAEHVVLFNMHHIASDGWSMGVLMRELRRLYEAYKAGEESPLEPLRVQYADYASWQRGWLRGEVLEDQLGYWRHQLAGLPLVHSLPLDRPRPARQGFEGGEHVQRLGRELKDRLDAACRESGTTLFMFLQAAFALLLGRYSHETDVVMGTPIAGRVHRDLEPLIGFFVNTLVLRSDLAGDPRFGDLLRSSRQGILDAYAHQHVPFEMLVEDLRPERSLSHSPLFQVLLVLQNRDRGEEALGGSRLEWFGSNSGVVKFDLELYALELEDGLSLSWYFNKDLFLPATIERMASGFGVLLEDVLAGADRRLSEIRLLTDAERLQLAAWDETGAGLLAGQTLPGLFEAQAARTPEAVAVVCGAESLSYRELDARAGRLAARLRGLGVGPEVRVGVLLRRSTDLVAALLGVLKAGGSYVPLDPAYPRERLAFYLGDSGAAVLVSEPALLDVVPGFEGPVVFVDGSGEETMVSAAAPEHLAYVIYTSGSTGRPKGVAIEHRAAAAMLGWALQTYGREELSGVLASTSVCFDLSVFELFAPLSCGGRVVLVDNALALPSVADAEVTLVNTVPSAMAELCRMEALPASVRTVNLAGEPLARSLVEEIYRTSRVERVWNLYGPSEDTTYSTSYLALRGSDREPAIGRPLPGTRVHLLGPDRQPVSVGVPGELCLAGAGLARGYLGRSELTAERFVPDPSGAAGERLYRTGDLARYRPDGTLEYLGRLDHQVKLRGFRIELGEIESRLRSLAEVKDAVVLAREDRPGEKRLVSYVVPSERRPQADDLKIELRKTLPEHMIPSVFVTLEALPLTANGKVDRRALPAPEESHYRRGEHVAPGTELERALCGIWQELLGAERIGIDDNFFDLGGHSLLATRVVSQVRARLGRELPLRALFEHPTVRALAARLAELGGEGVLPPIERLPRTAGLPLSYAQQRLWFLDRLEGGSSHYNISGAVRVYGDLDREAFARALSAIVERHEPLRTVFQESDGEIWQFVQDGSGFRLAEEDLSGLAPEEREREVARRAVEHARKPFDLERDLLLRAALLELSEREHVVLINMHHIAADAWSMGVLLRELRAVYEGSPLEPLRAQYADYASWQRLWLRDEVLERELAYWREQLAGVPLLHGLPLDNPRPARQGFEAGEHLQRLGGELRERLQAACRESGVTPFMLLQAAFSVLLGRYSNERDVVVGSPIAGRVHRDLEPLIGFFVNTLVLRADLSRDPRFTDLLQSTRRTVLDAYAHQHVPFEMLVEELRPERSLSHSPLFQIVFALQNVERGDAALGGARLEWFGGNQGIVKFDLELVALELEDGLDLMWSYKKELFHPGTIERMASAFGVLLESILERPEAPEDTVWSLSLLNEAQRRQLLSGWRERGAAYPRDRSLPELFEEQVERSPDRIALAFEGGRLTYRELNERANRLARFLAAEGVAAEAPVGLCMERSPEMMVGILGILKAGGAYLPLDPEYPEARLRYMVEDAALSVVLTQSRLAGLGCFAGCRTVPLDDPGVAAELERLPAADSRGPRPGRMAYVIYTSGSTGQPKGVMVEHRSVARLAIGPDFVPLDADTVMLQISSISFDAATLEIWGALLNGGRLVLYPERVPEIGRLNALLERQGVNTMWLTAGLFDQWSHQLPRSSTLRWVLAGGDVVDPLAVARVYEAIPGVQVINGYGPTENTTFTACHPIPRGFETGRPVPLGRPIHGTGVYVLQEGAALAPPGGIGELCAVGDGLARGYLDRPDLTAERFPADPYSESDGGRLYRTGDLARWRVDGTLEFLGRLDGQVKIRGFRVELGEIETQLRSRPAVRDATVLARTDRPGEKRLVAYVVPAEGIERSSLAGDLKAALQESLPDYMVPSAFVVLDALPLTANGKIDRRALPAPEEGSYPRSGYVPPRTELEGRLCDIWAELLGVGRVGIEDSFFDLGGHSLLATRVVSRVRADLGRDLPLEALFEHPTIAGLCDALPELGGGWDLPPIEPLETRDRLPLSYAQQRLWFIDRLDGGSVHYNIPAAARVRGRLDRDAFVRALRTIVERHEALRTVFRERNGEVHQVVREGVELRLAEEDLGRLEPEERERRVGRLALEDARRPFDLSRDLMLRATLLRLAPEEHVVLFNMHHIASDGWSVGVFLRELGTLYEAFQAGRESPLEPLRIQYADYAGWQREWLQGEVLEEHLGYWRDHLAGLPVVHDLPLDRPRPARQGFEGGDHAQRFGRELQGRMESAARDAGATLFMFLQAAFSVLLSRYSHETDVVVGSPIAGRVHRDLEPLIGFFVNTLVLRADLSGDPRFTDLLAAGKRTILDAYTHQHVPFETLVEELRPERSLSHSPLFQILLTLQNNERIRTRLGPLDLEPLGEGSGIMKFDLELMIAELDGGLALHWLYKKELFDAATIERMAGHFQALAAAFAGDPDVSIADLPLLSATERRQMLAEWNDTGSPEDGELRLHDLFSARAAETPEAVALVDGERELTYGELAWEARRLAHHLRSLGVGPERIVGVCLERTAGMVAALLAVLEAGGAYLPLDPAHPRARLERVLADSGAAVVITQESLLEKLPWSGRAVVLERIIADIADIAAIDACPSERVEAGASRENLAYALFTSGSTGTPKGVAVTHRSAVELVLWAKRVFPAEDLAGVLAATSLSFDLSVFELFVPLSWGGTAILAANALALPELPGRDRVRLVNTVPSALAELVRTGGLPAGVRTVNLAGEPLPRALADRIWATGTVEALWNLYGPSEDTTYSTFAWVDRASTQAPRIGRPVAATRAYAVDRRGEPVPVGVAGELWLGGAGLARGYLGRPDLTAERFIPDPFGGVTGSRLYRTGDLVRWLADGELEFLGRIDHQVKVRGFRIELGEIEAQLLTHPSLREAVVIAREDRPGERRLVAYVVGKEGSNPDAGRLRDHLAAKLPEYMIPAVFVNLEWMPLNPNGKVDRRALPAPEAGDFQRGEYVAPRTELERRLCEIWEELLGVEPVGIEDNFFDLGGHSLLATQVVSRVRSSLGLELPLRALFEHPTVGGLSDRLPELSGGLFLPAIEVVADRDRLPLSYAQQRLWFIDRLEGESSQYNVPNAVRVRGGLDKEAFARALRTVVARHESLRTTFHEAEGELYQTISGEADLRLWERDLGGMEPEAREREVQRLALEDERRSFDLSRDLLLRAGLLTLAEDEHVVLLNMHHIASDGWSMGVLMRELGVLYEAYRNGEESPLEPLRVQYADYASWQRQWLRGEVLESQLSYWRHQLAGLLLVHNLPLDRPRPAREGFEGGEHVQRLGLELRGRLDAACRESGVTLFMFLQAAFALLLSRYSHETDIVMGSPIAGRVHRDVEPLIGLFINTLVLRSDLSRDPRFVDLLEAGKQTILDAYAHQHVPFEMLVEDLRPERSLSHSPLFQILFLLRNAEQADVGLADSRLEPLGGGVSIVRFDLELNALEVEDGLTLNWYYKKELFHPATIERMASGFLVLLEDILAGGDRRLSEIGLLGEAERRQLAAWNDTGGGLLAGNTLPGLFEAQAARTPEAVAVVCGAESLSYRELDARAGRLAARLRGLGVGPEVRVGVLLRRSADLLAALLGVLKAGGSYVPLDPAYPRERLAFYLNDSGATVLVGEPALLDAVPDFEGPVVFVDGAGEESPVASAAAPEHLAYVIYTSGSTGRPKGVAIEHRAAAAMLGWALQAYGPDELSAVLASTSVCFDLSVFELFAPLSCGGRVVLVDNALALPSAAGAGVTLVNTVPSAMAELCRMEALPASVRTVNLAGEPLVGSLVEEIYRTSRAERVWNLYGPSEDTTYSTSYPVLRGSLQEPAIGRPLPGTRVHLLGPDRRPVPVGVPGELCLAGAGLARGYLGRSDLTAERFVPDPFGPAGERLYRTGDLARFRPDGTLEYLGRLDHQVKLRGFRIELGEIESRLRSLAEVKDAVVLAREDRPGEKRLVGYVVPSGERRPQSDDLKTALQKALPEHMVPSVFVVLDSLPLTASGKVDRRALPAPEESHYRRGEHVAPRTELERGLCEVWAEVLGVPRVGIEDNFFDLGGHSLLVIKLVSKINARFQSRLGPRQLFENATVRRLAATVEAALEGGPEAQVWQPLVTLSKDCEAPQLYLVPGAGMFSIALQPLARALSGKAALHVLEARGLDGNAPPQTSLAEIVDSYGSAIRKRQPQGPYTLVGHSFGGSVAFELARWLEERGETASLILLDSFLDLDAWENRPTSSHRDDWEQALRDAGALPDLEPDAVLRGFLDVLRRQLDLQASYHPSGTVRAPITLLYASRGAIAQGLDRVLEVYERVAEQPVRCFAVEGDHLSMLSDDHAPELAERILACSFAEVS